MIAEAGIFLVINTSRLVQGASDQITAKLVKKKFTERVIPYVKLRILSRPRNRAKLIQSLWMLGEGTPRPRPFHSTIQGEQNGYFAHPSDFQGEQVLTLLTLFRSPCIDDTRANGLHQLNKSRSSFIHGFTVFLLRAGSGTESCRVLSYVARVTGDACSVNMIGCVLKYSGRL